MGECPVAPVVSERSKGIVFRNAEIPENTGHLQMEENVGFRPKMVIVLWGNETAYVLDGGIYGSIHPVERFQITDTGLSYTCSYSSSKQTFTIIVFP